MALFEDMERLKLRFLAAFQRLTEKGLLAEGQLAEIIELVDKLDDMSVDEIEAQLGRYITDVALANGDDSGKGGGKSDAAFA